MIAGIADIAVIGNPKPAYRGYMRINADISKSLKPVLSAFIRANPRFKVFPIAAIIDT